MPTPPKPPVQGYWIIRETEEDVLSRISREKIRAGAKYLDVITDEHKSIIRESEEHSFCRISRERIRADAANHLGVTITTEHKWKIATVEVPETARNAKEEARTLMMHTPDLTPWPIDIVVWYLTNDTWWINGKKDGGRALILMCGGGKPGEPYNDIQITFDETVNKVTSMFAYLPKA